MQSFYDELETVIDHEYKVNSMGRVTKFRRTNKQSEEVAKKYTIMRRLQLKLENLAGTKTKLNFVFAMKGQLVAPIVIYRASRRYLP